MIRFFLHTSRSQHKSHEYLQMWCYAGFVGGGVFAWSLVLMHSTWHIVVSLPRELCFSYTDESSCTRKKFASLNLARSFVIRIECSSRKSCPRKLAHSLSCSQRALDLGRTSRITARPLKYYRSQI